MELRTLLAEVESIVNNRPITAVSHDPDDPDDCSALTPNHFLLQRATQLPPGLFVNEDLFSRKRWRKEVFTGEDGEVRSAESRQQALFSIAPLPRCAYWRKLVMMNDY